MTSAFITPDSRGRFALGPYTDQDATYLATVDDDGTITLAPIAATLSPQQVADLKADPQGYVDMMTRAENASSGNTVPASAIFE